MIFLHFFKILQKRVYRKKTTLYYKTREKKKITKFGFSGFFGNRRKKTQKIDPIFSKKTPFFLCFYKFFFIEKTKLAL